MNILVFVGFIFVILPAFFLFVFLYIPKKVREIRLRKIADQFGLTFDSGLSDYHTFSPYSPSYKRNILKGNINGHFVEIYDLYEIRYIYFRYYRRVVILNKDGQTEEIKNFFVFILPSVHKIKTALDNIKSN